MANRPALFKQSEITSVAKAMQAAGIVEWRYEIDPASGKRVIITGAPSLAEQKSDWDK